MDRCVPNKIVLIGASTGGPGQIQKIVNTLDSLNDTTVIIAQHMQDSYIPSFTEQLQHQSKSPLSIVSDNIQLDRGHIYICSGVTEVKKDGSRLIFRKSESEKLTYNPNINSIFHSLVPFADDIRVLSVILTGIGDDGVDGCMQLGLKGCRCLTENEDSAIVDGMPSRARESVKDIEISSLDDILQIVKGFCS